MPRLAVIRGDGIGPEVVDEALEGHGDAIAVVLHPDGSVEVRRFVIDNALRWLRDFRIDALRLDAVHALVDDSPRHRLAELADEAISVPADSTSVVQEAHLVLLHALCAVMDEGFMHCPRDPGAGPGESRKGTP